MFLAHVHQHICSTLGKLFIFDTPQILFEPNVTCPLGASFETRYEGCEL